MAIAVFIIIALVVFFLFDKRDAQKSVKSQGGLQTKFSTFIQWAEIQGLSVNNKELVQTKLSNSVIEYRRELYDSENKRTKGYIFYTLTHLFATTIGCRVELRNGYKHKGYMKEINELDAFKIDTYEDTFNSILKKIFGSPEFQNNYEKS